MKLVKMIPAVILAIAYAIIPAKSSALDIEELTLVDENVPDKQFFAQGNVVHMSDGSVVHTYSNVAHTSDGSVVHTYSNVAHTSDGSVVHTFSNVGHTSNGGVIHSPFGHSLFSESHALPTPNVAMGSITMTDLDE